MVVGTDQSINSVHYEHLHMGLVKTVENVVRRHLSTPVASLYPAPTHFPFAGCSVRSTASTTTPSRVCGSCRSAVTTPAARSTPVTTIDSDQMVVGPSASSRT